MYGNILIEKTAALEEFNVRGQLSLLGYQLA